MVSIFVSVLERRCSFLYHCCFLRFEFTSLQAHVCLIEGCAGDIQLSVLFSRRGEEWKEERTSV